MPWRKEPHNIPDMAEQIAKVESNPPASQANILTALELITEKIFASIKWLAAFMVVLTFLIIALGWQIQSRNAIIDRVDTTSSQAQIAASEARIAATRASSDLTAAIKSSQNSSANPAIIEAFTSIFRIDCKLNGTQSSCDYMRNGFPVSTTTSKPGK